MFYFPKDFREMTLNNLVDTGAKTYLYSGAHFIKIKLFSSTSSFETDPAPIFQSW